MCGQKKAVNDESRSRIQNHPLVLEAIVSPVLKGFWRRCQGACKALLEVLTYTTMNALAQNECSLLCKKSRIIGRVRVIVQTHQTARRSRRLHVYQLPRPGINFVTCRKSLAQCDGVVPSLKRISPMTTHCLLCGECSIQIDLLRCRPFLRATLSTLNYKQYADKTCSREPTYHFLSPISWTLYSQFRWNLESTFRTICLTGWCLPQQPLQVLGHGMMLVLSKVP